MEARGKFATINWIMFSIKRPPCINFRTVVWVGLESLSHVLEAEWKDHSVLCRQPEVQC